MAEVEIRGLRQLGAGLQRLARSITEAAPRDAVQPAAEQAADSIRARVPHRTGRLAASVHTARHGTTVQVRMGDGLAYARWIEYGRGGPAMGRYVYPTAKSREDQFRRDAERVAHQQIRGMRWQSPS